MHETAIPGLVGTEVRYGLTHIIENVPINDMIKLKTSTI